MSASTASDPAKAKKGLLANLFASESVLHALILGAICVLAFLTRLFSVVRYESVIHEFDPCLSPC